MNQKLKFHKDGREVYSGLDDLPKGQASDQITPGCLILEGGAFRGVYTNGVLDALMEEDINLACTVGVSAGALNGYNYVAGQIGRSARVNLGHRHDSRYVGATALKNNAGIIGFDYIFGDYNKEDPFNRERFEDPRRRFVAVATDCKTGKPICFEKGKCSHIEQAIRASASMPYLSKIVEVDGVPCLDGGCSAKVPYQWAIKHQYEKIVVVQTHAKGYRRKEHTAITDMAPYVYPNYPKFAKAQKYSSVKANRAADEMERLEKEGRIFVIYPSIELNVSRIDGDMEKLGTLYYLGYYNAKDTLPELKKYLEIPA